METEESRLNKSGLPKGSVVGYVRRESCGRRKHRFVVANTGTYAVCVKCHMIMVLETKGAR